MREVSRYNECSLNKCIYEEQRQQSQIRGIIDKIFVQFDATRFEEDREG